MPKAPKQVRNWQAQDTGSYESVFCQKIPNLDLRLLSGEQNLGAVEIIVLMPHSLRNGDVIKRLIMNGWTQEKIANALNYYCNRSRGGIKRNSVLKWISEGMKSITGQAKWARRTDLAQMDRTNWNANDITLTGCKLNIEHHPAARGSRFVIQNIPLRDLGRHVRQLPEGDDKVDLTRFVRYAMQHPEEDLHYPRDFDMLAQKLGRTPVTLQHVDGAAATRWSQPKPITQQTQSFPPAMYSSATSGSAAPFHQPPVVPFTSRNAAVPLMPVTESSDLGGSDATQDGESDPNGIDEGSLPPDHDQQSGSSALEDDTTLAMALSPSADTHTIETSVEHIQQSSPHIPHRPVGIFGDPVWDEWRPSLTDDTYWGLESFGDDDTFWNDSNNSFRLTPHSYSTTDMDLPGEPQGVDLAGSSHSPVINEGGAKVPGLSSKRKLGNRDDSHVNGQTKRRKNQKKPTLVGYNRENCPSAPSSDPEDGNEGRPVAQLQLNEGPYNSLVPPVYLGQRDITHLSINASLPYFRPIKNHVTVNSESNDGNDPMLPEEALDALYEIYGGIPLHTSLYSSLDPLIFGDDVSATNDGRL